MNTASPCPLCPVVIDVVALQFRARPSSDRVGAFCSASAWASIVDATNRREAWAIELGDRYWNAKSASPELFDALNRAHVPLGEWICGKFETNANQIRPDVFLDASTQRSEGSAASSWASWLTSIYGAHGTWRHRNRTGILPVSSPRARRNEISPPTYGAPASGPWAGWIAAAAFDSNPTAENLAIAMDAMAKGPSPSYWKSLQWRASWPLAVCISSADDSAAFQNYAGLLRAGQLGEQADWTKAERTWKETIDLTTVLNEVDESTPWVVDSLMRAPPLLAIPLWRLVDRIHPRAKKAPILETVRRANELFLTTSSLVLKQRLAEICLATWRHLPAKKNPTEFDPKKWIESAPGSATLLIPRPKSLPLRNWQELLDASNTDAINPVTLYGAVKNQELVEDQRLEKIDQRPIKLPH